MDIKQTINDLVKMLTKDPALIKRFKDNPVKVIEDKIGIDLPDDIVNGIIEGVKGKLTLESGKEALEGLGKLFKK